MSDAVHLNVIDSFRLDGRVAVITGAASGLGAGFALALAGAGARVVLGGRRLERLNEVKERIVDAGGDAVAIQTDVTEPVSCSNLVGAAMSHYGRVDVLVNSAGVGAAVPASRETPDEFRRVIDTNLMGSYWMAQASAKHMTPGSSIINVSSVLALTSAGLPQAAYASSKAALLGLTIDLAQQWGARKGIRVNALAPGYFPSEMTDVMDVDQLGGIVERRVPLGRLGRVEECAAAVVFLASDAASFITGICLPVDGGFLTS
ncbi:MAG TPA: SDR family oxidoreductase [Acidimicrobiales bacterium]|nr:SDR family oxidoreductase [Acidimicrobiales bacterium]